MKRPNPIRILGECLMNAVGSFRATLRMYSSGEETEEADLPSLEGIEEFLMEAGVTPEELQEGSDSVMVDMAIADSIESPQDMWDSVHMQANEYLLSSKCFIQLSVDDSGEVSVALDTSNASVADISALQVMCSKFSESLYDKIGKADEG
jgi:hypothetical protein